MICHKVKSVGNCYDLYTLACDDRQHVTVSRHTAGASLSLYLTLEAAEELAQAITLSVADARAKDAEVAPMVEDAT